MQSAILCAEVLRLLFETATIRFVSAYSKALSSTWHVACAVWRKPCCLCCCLLRWAAAVSALIPSTHCSPGTDLVTSLIPEALGNSLACLLALCRHRRWQRCQRDDVGTCLCRSSCQVNTRGQPRPAAQGCIFPTNSTQQPLVTSRAQAPSAVSGVYGAGV